MEFPDKAYEYFCRHPWIYSVALFAVGFIVGGSVAA